MKLMTPFFLFLVMAYVSAYDLDVEWESFKNKFKKSYLLENEMDRKNIFKHNLELIEAHNKKYEAGEVTFKMGVNQFADLTKEEYEQIYLNHMG